jgi:hypothetical protein
MLATKSNNNCCPSNKEIKIYQKTTFLGKIIIKKEKFGK